MTRVLGVVVIAEQSEGVDGARSGGQDPCQPVAQAGEVFVGTFGDAIVATEVGDVGGPEIVVDPQVGRLHIAVVAGVAGGRGNVGDLMGLAMYWPQMLPPPASAQFGVAVTIGSCPK